MKKLFSLLLATAIVLSMAVVTAFAAETYDPATHTLTLEDATISPIEYTDTEDYTIILKGNNTIEGPASCAIKVTSANLTIKGDGTLTATDMKQFISTKGNITICEKVKLNCTNTTASNFAGIMTSASTAKISISDEAQIVLKGFKRGIYAGAESGDNTLSFTGNPVVDIEATELGIYSARDINFNLSENGQIKATSSTSYPIATASGFKFIFADYNEVIEPENSKQGTLAEYNFFTNSDGTNPTTVVVGYNKTSNTESTTEPTTKAAETITNTGDNTPIAQVAVLTLLASAALVTTIKKNEE